MKVPLHVVLARREQIAQMLSQHRYLPLAEICARFHISEATARRDLAALQGENKVTRTYGGALSDFNQRFPSFQQRQNREPEAKYAIASAAAAMITTGQTLYLDAGTTIFNLAEQLASRPPTGSLLRIVTNNLPVAEILADTPGIECYLLGGQFFARQSVLLGKMATKSLRFWRFDHAFLSAQGIDTRGIWNSQRELVAFQRQILARSNTHAFCLDASKFGKTAPFFMVPVADIKYVISNGTPADLAAHHIALPPERFLSVKPTPISTASIAELAEDTV